MHSTPTRSYFIFANKPDGEWDYSYWDTSEIIRTGECYFTSSDPNISKPQKGDVIIFKEFGTKILWGEAIIDSPLQHRQTNGENELTEDGKEIVYFKLSNIQKWLYKLETNVIQEKLTNQSVRLRIIGITEDEYSLIIKEMESKSRLSPERQEQIKGLWAKYKAAVKPEKWESIRIESETLLSQWNEYKEKILNGSLALDDYTNRLGNPTAKMPGGYLCNFLERTTRNIFGSSKPGNAENFEVKLNSDDTYYIKRDRKEQATKEEAEVVFKASILPLLKDLVSAPDDVAAIAVVDNAAFSAKQILMKIVVLQYPASFLSIYGDAALQELYNEFSDHEEQSAINRSYVVCTLAKELFGISDISTAEMSVLSSFLWKYVTSKTYADQDNPNVIVYGPPGTGKTFGILESIEFVAQGNTRRYEVLQFHPSFTYEDFIEGIKPKGVVNGQIRFELVDGAFKKFCIRAAGDPDNDYYFIVDEINRANLSTVFGEVLFALEKEYRHNPKDKESIKNLVKTQYAPLIEDLISENSDNSSHAYRYINDLVYFGVPKNVFFIGMMNDVDKSIDAFDLALRRRFKWIRKDCDYEVIEDETRFRGVEDFTNITAYRKACEELNHFISDELGLGKSYEFGHSFFMKMSVIAKRKIITSKNAELLFELHLKPTLKEYLRAIYSEGELEEKLSNASDRFKAVLK